MKIEEMTMMEKVGVLGWTDEELAKLSKVELVELVQVGRMMIEDLKKRGKKGSGRKLELLEIMSKGGGKILDLAAEMKLNSKNVSSLLCYLKKDGWGIIVNENGERVITKYKGENIDGAFIEDFVKRERSIAEHSESEAAE